MVEDERGAGGTTGGRCAHRGGPMPGDVVDLNATFGQQFLDPRAAATECVGPLCYVRLHVTGGLGQVQANGPAKVRQFDRGATVRRRRE
jgi:hypothetical protein